MVRKLFTVLGIIVPVAALGGLFAYAYPIFNTTWYEYVEPSENLTKIEVSPITYHDLGEQSFYNSGMKRAMPATGDVNLLCIPVQFSDYPFSEETMTDLNVVFNGESEDTGYWESLSTYYEKSSFGQLKINVEVAPTYDTGKTTEEFASGSNPTDNLAKSAVENYFAAHSDYGKFDGDDNGYIDGLYLIYSCPDYSVASKDEDSYYNKYEEGDSKRSTFKSIFWAYTAWYTSYTSPTTSPLRPNGYVWASYDFMYMAVSSPKVDSHTYVHETGHLLGLADYYNSVGDEDAYLFGKYAHYLPCGGLQMMDHNIGDFDAWTKFSLGWNSAYIVDKDKPFPQTFELKDSTLEGDLLLIPAIEDDSYEDIEDYGAFGEYIALELYSPAGVNTLDSKLTNYKYGYLGNYPPMYSITGVRASHIDARLASGSTYRNPTLEEVKAASGYACYSVLARNLLTERTATASSSRVFWLNQLLESSGQETLVTENSFANNGTLFKGNDKQGDFSMTKFSEYFTIKDDSGNPLFNNGKKFGYTFRINGEITGDDGVRRVSITVDKEGE